MKPLRRTTIFTLEGIPSLKRAFPLATQHVVPMIAGCVTPALILARVANLSAEDSIMLVQGALVIASLATFLQLIPIGRYLGSGLLVILGVSFAYLLSMQGIAAGYDIASIFGSQLVGGGVAILVGIFVKQLRKFFPPLITGTVVFTIGLSLYPTAINYMAGGLGNPTFGSAQNWTIALITLSVVTTLNHFGIKLEISACFALGILFAINAVQAIGDFTATYSQNVGIVTTTKVINRITLDLAAMILLVAGLVPKFAAILTTIPQCVLGGATISVFASIAMTGMKLVVPEEMNCSTTSIVGLAAALGIGIADSSAAISTFPGWFQVIFGQSPVVIATIVAVALGIMLPKTKKGDRDIYAESHP